MIMSALLNSICRQLYQNLLFHLITAIDTFSKYKQMCLDDVYIYIWGFQTHKQTICKPWINDLHTYLLNREGVVSIYVIRYQCTHVYLLSSCAFDISSCFRKPPLVAVLCQYCIILVKKKRLLYKQIYPFFRNFDLCLGTKVLFRGYFLKKKDILSVHKVMKYMISKTIRCFLLLSVTICCCLLLWDIVHIENLIEWMKKLRCNTLVTKGEWTKKSRFPPSPKNKTKQRFLI